MLIRWFVEAAGLFATTSGALVIFMAHRRLHQALTEAGGRQANPPLDQQFRRLSVALALLAASLVLQCAAMFFTP